MNPYGKNFVEFFKQDMKDVGTKNYKGYAYFWNMKYKWDLRETTPRIRRQIHKIFLDEGLDLSGDTERHDEVVNRFIRRKEHRNKMSKCYGESQPHTYTQL